MSVRHLFALALAAVVLAPASAFAGGYLKSKGCCAPQPVICKQKVFVPPVTRTVYKKVMVSPGGCVNRRVPAVYGWQQRTYVAQPATQRVVAVPPIYGTVQTVQQVSPGYVTSAYGCRKGCGYKCPVVVPPSYAKVNQPVVMAPAQTWVEQVPPVMGVASERVVLQPEHTQQFCEPPVYRVVAKQVVVSPGRWIWRSGGGCGRY